jgi:tripartite-type tricarboxylate transporter receptor subunit TctC
MRFAGTFVALGLVAFSLAPVRADWTPTKPITIIVGFPPGGSADMMARTLAAASRELFPVPLVVINRPGAGGTLAATFLTRQKPDGYTLLVAGGSESTSVPHHRRVRYALSDFDAVIRCIRSRIFIISRSDSGITSLGDLIARAQKQPAKLTYGSPGPGTLYHSTMLLFTQAAGIRMRHLPFQGGPAMMSALLGGHIDITLAAPEEAQAQHAAGKIRFLALASLDRSELHPQVPTLAELGFDVVLENQKGFVAPSGLPENVRRYLHDRFRLGLETATWKQTTGRLAMEPGYLDGPAFMRALQDMSGRIARSVQEFQRQARAAREANSR